jgi:hypothetical protein
MIAALLSIQAMGHLEGLGTALFVLLILSALVECFFGYVLFRLVLVFVGLVGGALLGTVAASWLRAEPSGLDYFVACFTCVVISVLLAWFLYRVAFAIFAAGGVAAAIVVGVLGKADSGGAWVFGGVVGVAVGIYALIYTRGVFIVLSSLSGAFSAVFATAVLIIGPIDDPSKAWTGALSQRWLIVMLCAISMALAGAGIYVQVKLSRSIRLVLMPQDQPLARGKSAKGRKRSRRNSRIGPRFTRV